MSANQSSALSPGAGIIPVTRTSASTGSRSATSGAVKPPNDWATTTRSFRPPMASTTVSAYSGRPAASSSHGKSGATTSCPRRRNSASTKCQYHPTSPAPWISTNVAIRSTFPELAEHGLDEVVLEPGEPAIHGVRGRGGVGRVDGFRLGVVGDAQAGAEGERGVVDDAEPRLDLFGRELDLGAAAFRRGTVERGVDELEGRQPGLQELGVHELLPLLLGALLGGVEIRGGEQPVVHRVVLGRRVRHGVAHLVGDGAQQLDLVGVQRDDDPFAAALEARAHEGCSIVAHRPWACSRATSASAFSRVPSDTAALPSWCTCSMSRVAFSREYPNSFWNT